MQHSFSKFRRSSRKFIEPLLSKMNVVKRNMVFVLDEGNVTNEKSKSKKTTLKFSRENIQTLCEQLEQFIDYIRNFTNFEYFIHVYPSILERRLENNVQELENMLKEIKSTQIHIRKQKMQTKFVDKEIATITKTLNKLKDTEIHEMETIVSLFDKAMYSRWETMKTTRKPELLEGFLSDIKSKQLAMENLNTLVSRRLKSLKMFPSMRNFPRNKINTKAIPLALPLFDAASIATTSITPRPLPLPSKLMIIPENVQASRLHLKIE